ncbi:hypothetical protein CkaCkLH20_07203 [Colletotrichum karsti]|uniref:DUF676 domain-containing protein n=1 Tax=Colletotrichum karsti TaxID=1095194 RepID=A0A9P6LJ71_9PEZI|nr:uncharacterized protein CkaCkLH20_07203 [Colletotrichum karsti]KAF9875383.1 hypothetical protein CkaCkLH20_07203 [Colletotrichum karsti]
MASRQDKAWTYRVENIPYDTTVEQLIERHFFSEDQNHLSVKSIFPSVDAIEGEEENFELTATVLFKPPTPRPEGLRVPPSSDITVSKQFQGFTPLYVPPADTKIDADVIAITGLAGHAYGSWAWSEERMWLRDDLKKDVANARILTYGYDSECENRPIIFIGHSLGCLIIKKVMIEAWEKGIHGARLPVRAIVFLAAPHRGLDVQALQSLVKQTPSKQLVSELERNSPTLRDLNSRFRRFGDEIDILTCYEMKQTKTVMETEDGSWVRKGKYVTMVDQESATLSYPREKAKGVAEDHSKIAKIRRTQGGIYPNIRSAIKRALRPTVTVADEHQTSSLRAQEPTHGQAAVPWASPYHHGELYSQAHPLEATSSSMYRHGEAGGLHVIGTPYRPTTPSQTWPRHLTEVPMQMSHRFSTANLARSLSDGTLVSLEPPQAFLAGGYSRSSTPQPPQPPTRSQSQPEPLAVPTLEPSEPELKLNMMAKSVSEQELESNSGAESETGPEVTPAPQSRPEPEMKVAMPWEELSATSTEPKVQPRAELDPQQDIRPYPECSEAISDPDSRPSSEEMDRQLEEKRKKKAALAEAKEKESKLAAQRAEIEATRQRTLELQRQLEALNDDDDSSDDEDGPRA